MRWFWVKRWQEGCDSVRQDWVACLPEEKQRVFDAVVQDLDSSYSMLSVALNDALAFRGRGMLVRGRRGVGMAAELSPLLAQRLLGVIETMADHGKHYGTLPSVAPLEPGFFRSFDAQMLARWNGLVEHALLGDRSRFFHKLQALARLVETLVTEFRSTGEEIFEGVSVRPGSHWEALDHLHYDLNTCLRETIVMFKSFLRALPGEQVELLGTRLAALPPSGVRAPVRVLRVSR